MVGNDSFSSQPKKTKHRTELLVRKLWYRLSGGDREGLCSQSNVCYVSSIEMELVVKVLSFTAVISSSTIQSKTFPMYLNSSFTTDSSICPHGTSSMIV